LLIESVRMDMYLRFCPKHVRVPVLLLLAGGDRIIHNERTRRFVERFAGTDKTLSSIPKRTTHWNLNHSRIDLSTMCWRG